MHKQFVYLIHGKEGLEEFSGRFEEVEEAKEWHKNKGVKWEKKLKKELYLRKVYYSSSSNGMFYTSLLNKWVRKKN